MSSRVLDIRPDQGTIWYEGALMAIKARSEETAGALGIVEANFPTGFTLLLHLHCREDEALYVLASELRGRRGQEEFTAGPGDFILLARGMPHTFTVQEGGARALVLVTPVGFEKFFQEAGMPARHGATAGTEQRRREDDGARTAVRRRGRWAAVGVAQSPLARQGQHRGPILRAAQRPRP